MSIPTSPAGPSLPPQVGAEVPVDRAALAVARAEVSAAETTDETVRRRMIEFCQAHPDALHRRCLAGHLTGSALVVEPSSRRVLLLHHTKLRRWLQPGGHADGDGDLGRVALREATEETGLTDLRLVRPAIDLDIHPIPARGDEPAHFHLDVRYLVLSPRLDHHINEESTAARWFDGSSFDQSSFEVAGDLSRLVAAGLRRLDTLCRLDTL